MQELNTSTTEAAPSRLTISGEGRVLYGKRVLGEVDYDLVISPEPQFDAFGQTHWAPVIEGDLYRYKASGRRCSRARAKRSQEGYVCVPRTRGLLLW